MTTLTTAWFTEPAHALGSVVRALRATFEGIQDGLTLRSRYEELSRLSDSELARRGIRREDIARMAMTARYI